MRPATAVVILVGIIALAGLIVACIGLQAHVGALAVLAAIILAAYTLFCWLMVKAFAS